MLLSAFNSSPDNDFDEQYQQRINAALERNREKNGLVKTLDDDGATGEAAGNVVKWADSPEVILQRVQHSLSVNLAG